VRKEVQAEISWDFWERLGTLTLPRLLFVFSYLHFVFIVSEHNTCNHLYTGLIFHNLYDIFSVYLIAICNETSNKLYNNLCESMVCDRKTYT
jgi:hypothetical protein